MNSHPSGLTLVLALALGLGLDLTAAVPAAPGADVITDIKQALATIPRETMKGLGNGSDTKLEIVTEANEHLKSDLKGKAATLKMTVATILKFQLKEVPRTRIVDTNDPLRVSGTTFGVYFSAVIDESELPKLAKLTKGSRITVTGKIDKLNLAVVEGKGKKAGQVKLAIELMDAKLE